MSNRIKRVAKTINEKGGFFTFLRAQFSSQISSQFDFLVSIVCVNVFGIFYGNATLIGNVSGGLLNCFINYRWTFKAKGIINVRYVLIKFFMVWMVSIVLNRQGTILFTETIMYWIPVNKLPDIIVENIFLVPKIVVSIIVGLVWNYNMQRLFVYKDRNFRKYWYKITGIEQSENQNNDF
ncbi:MAG: GtrA family protein [Dysgonomonas sp.]